MDSSCKLGNRQHRCADIRVLLLQAAIWKTLSNTMAEPLDPKDLVSLDELAITNMWEIGALVEVLERLKPD